MARVRFAVNLFMRREAEFSECRQYRYTLRIIWNEDLPVCAFIGLNPSTADEIVDDATIRRCRGYAEAWGCGGLLMLNLFGLRSTDPRVLRHHPAPIGGGNTIAHIKRRLAECTGPHIACWGGGGMILGRGEQVAGDIPSLMCLRINDDGTPAHPLYLPASLTPIPYRPRGQEAR